MVTVCWSAAGVNYFSFLQPGQTITAEFYCRTTIVDEMYRKLCQQQPAPVNRKDPILLHDNTHLRVSQITARNLNKLSVKVLPHPPSPQTSLQPTTIFSSTTISFSPIEPPPIRTRQKQPSPTSSNSEQPIFMPTELIDLCYVGKSALI